MEQFSIIQDPSETADCASDVLIHPRDHSDRKINSWLYVHISMLLEHLRAQKCQGRKALWIEFEVEDKHAGFAFENTNGLWYTI